MQNTFMFGHFFVFTLKFGFDVYHQFLSTTQRSGCWQKFIVKHPKWGHNLTSHTWEISQRNWKNIGRQYMVNNHTHPFLNIIVWTRFFGMSVTDVYFYSKSLIIEMTGSRNKIPIIKKINGLILNIIYFIIVRIY